MTTQIVGTGNKNDKNSCQLRREFDKAKNLTDVIFTKEISALSTKAEQLEWKRYKVAETAITLTNITQSCCKARNRMLTQCGSNSKVAFIYHIFASIRYA